MKQPRYTFWAMILNLSGLNWRKVEPIDWSKLKPKKKTKKGGKGYQSNVER